ncbi:tail fiber assembly protein [Desulfobaculum bizertense]|uniref:Phage tail assembly chaperone protein n=1 Tax=Desulfobaculum bizertense DSM 18034 TaxID=1121442 RepID=A0A1T4W150_9BACT|nr:tail fiber assembly protein [Desulfobaculum bizertense]SKA70859.1 Phage tail assembly chaperone protein [Desulfobaculum bizertense DSM 18034]
MHALIWENEVIQIEENAFPVALPLRWASCDGSCRVGDRIGESGQIVPQRFEPGVDDLAGDVRRERDARLRACDPQALPDYPHESDGSEQAWLAYRQALRDLPSLPGFPWGGVSDPAIPWPQKPETPAASEE